MLALGVNEGVYYKRHLVPFGEFMPMRWLLEPLVDLLQIPMSDFAAGSDDKPLLTLAGYAAGVSICYEDAFGEEAIQALPEAAFLVNASNDAWFGDSLAPPQHLQIARMRALETGRFLLRSTNTGISAIIGPEGELLDFSPAFEEHVLKGQIQPMSGMTPYARVGNWAVVLLTLLMLSAGLLLRGEEKKAA
jgi:apolipoprotein N-acyltransferase